MNEATIKICVERASYRFRLFLITLLSLKWPEKYIRVFAKDLLIHHLLFVTKKEEFNGSVYKDDQGMSWESLLSQEISQTKKEVKQN
jgi:hypothetical protein